MRAVIQDRRRHAKRWTVAIVVARRSAQYPAQLRRSVWMVLPKAKASESA
jgi:hypothetical protein